MSTTLVIDGNNMLLRSVRAMEDVALEADGIPTAAILSFIGAISKYVRAVDPTHVVICWDGGHEGRSEISPEYKTNRGKLLHEGDSYAFGFAKEFLALAGFPQVGIPGVEADDLIAMYWRQRDPEEKFIILSGDKDFIQLLESNVTQIKPGPGAGDYWDGEKARGLHQTPLEAIPMMMALSGDKTDNVIGVHGIGWRTAATLLRQYDWSLEKLLVSDVKKIVGHEDQVRMNYRLVNLREDMGMCDVTLPPIPEFHPTGQTSVMHGMLLEFMKRLMLSRIEHSYVNGRLWSEQPRLDFGT